MSPKTRARKATALIRRQALAADAPGICAIVNYWAGKGIMLPRTEKEVLENLADFSVVEQNGEIVATGALAPYGKDLAELRSIAVSPKLQTKGLGRILVDFLLAKAKRKKYPRVFAFTYVPGFFEKFGLRIVPPESLPQKTWKDCFRCCKREGCDEIAMLKTFP